jgi:uncharacterized protein YjbI with pentapeptide repeats
MSDASGQSAQEHPAPEGYTSWPKYWTAQGTPWRTEPEIDTERQRFLAERRNIQPDIEQGLYPYKNIRLTRADVEWLLATHESGGMRGPLNWAIESKHLPTGSNEQILMALGLFGERRWGLDLRGADLHGVDMSYLPLACTRFGQSSFGRAQDILASIASIPMDSLDRETEEAGAAARLQGAVFNNAHLEGSDFSRALLIGAHFSRATMESCIFFLAHMEGSFLLYAHLEQALVLGAYLMGADLSGGYFANARLDFAHLEGADLSYADLQDAALFGAHLNGAQVPPRLWEQVQEWSKGFPHVLSPTDLHKVSFSSGTELKDVTLGNEVYGYVQLVGVQWGGIDLSVINWSHVTMMGDERVAREKVSSAGKPKDQATRRREFEVAVRANRQLAVALRSQGLNEDADKFAYRAQLLQQTVLWRQRKLGAYMFSRFIDGLAGYGYKPVRSLIAYVVLVLGFAVAYYGLGQTTAPHLQWYEALVVSLTAFHGRGFFSQQFSPGAPQSILAAAEAVVGLVIEISFIATFTQRFFGR